MASQYTLQAQTRTALGKKAQLLRDEGFLPAVVYGQGSEAISLAVATRDFHKVLQAAGESSLIDLSIDEKKPVVVLIHDLQRDPITGDLTHADFRQVKMDQKITASVPLIFTGESKAVKEMGGVLVTAHDHVTIECLPKDLLHELNVDLTPLENFSDAIHVSDIATPEGVTITGEPGTVVISVQEPRKVEEETPAVSEEDAVGKVEVEEKGKKEEADEKKEESKKD